jgi:hypothetical protein
VSNGKLWDILKRIIHSDLRGVDGFKQHMDSYAGKLVSGVGLSSNNFIEVFEMKYSQIDMWENYAKDI